MPVARTILLSNGIGFVPEIEVLVTEKGSPWGPWGPGGPVDPGEPVFPFSPMGPRTGLIFAGEGTRMDRFKERVLKYCKSTSMESSVYDKTSFILFCFILTLKTPWVAPTSRAILFRQKELFLVSLAT